MATTQMAWLLAGLLAVHFVGDFTVLATARMQESKATGGSLHWIGAHAAVHGVLSAAVLAAFAPGAAALWNAALITVTHFLIDTVRSRLGVRYEVLSDPTGKPFWTALGFDQLLHALVLVWVASRVIGA